VSRTHKVIASNSWIDEHLNGLGAILRADSGTDAMPWMSVNTDRKGCAAQARVTCCLRVQVQAITGLAIKTHTQVPTTDSREKINHFRRNEFGSNNKVAFVLAVLIINKDNRLPGAEVFKNLGDRAKGHRVNRLGESSGKDGNTIHGTNVDANP
jgi:hypothetical protein